MNYHNKNITKKYSSKSKNQSIKIFKFNLLKTYYKIQGKGPKLVFIPGTISDLRQSTNIFDTPLKNTFKILCYDLRGIGQTNSPLAKPTMLNYANDLKNLLDYIGWKKCHIIGESFGGMIAQEFVLNYPQMVDKLVLAVTSSGGKGGSSFPYHLYPIQKMSTKEKADFWVKAGDIRYQSILWKKTKMYKEEYEYYLNLFKLNESNAKRNIYSKRQIFARKQHNTFNRLPKIKNKTLICGGKYDRTAPIQNQIALFKQIPNSKLFFFDGSHMVLWIDPLAFESIKFFLLNKN